jgi:hypothetical protein
VARKHRNSPPTTNRNFYLFIPEVYTMSNHDTSLDTVREAFETLRTAIPTNNLSRELISELTAEVIRYHTGNESLEYEDNRFTVSNSYQADLTEPADVIRAINPQEMNAVRSVEYPENRDDDMIVVQFE